MPTGSYYSEESGDDRCISHRLESIVRGQSSERGLGSCKAEKADQLVGAINTVFNSETFCVLSQKSSCSGLDGQYNLDSLYKSVGRGTLSPAAQASDHMEQHEPLVIACDARSRNNEQWS